MPIATRIIATTDAARLTAALRDAAVPYAKQIDGEQTTLIFNERDAKAAADAIAAELSR
jgi:hypothetical protein